MRWSGETVAGAMVRLLVALVLCHAGTATAARHALIVAIESGPGLPARANALVEAQALAEVARGKGFDVSVQADGGAREVRAALRAFSQRLAPGDSVVVFVSAHAALRGGVAFVIPAQARDEADWIPVQEFLDAAKGRKDVLFAFDLSGVTEQALQGLSGHPTVIATRADAGTSKVASAVARMVATGDFGAHGQVVAATAARPSEEVMEEVQRGPRTRGLTRNLVVDQQPAGAAPPEPGLPAFPWPPPQPSTRAELSRTMFGGASSQQAVANQLLKALEQARYPEYSFYSAPGGFALVARLERMADDGTPLPEQLRFLSPSSAEPFSLATYVQRLFFAAPGYYRQIVFVSTDQPYAALGATLDAAGASKLLAEGANRLPAAFAAKPFTANHGVSALVYEYRKGAADRDVSVLTPGRLTARDHLMRAGLLPALGAR